jgi:hypothetical protein
LGITGFPEQLTSRWNDVPRSPAETGSPLRSDKQQGIQAKASKHLVMTLLYQF